MINRKNKPFIRLIALITLISFIGYEFAWASPDAVSMGADKLSPETIFTTEDRSDSFERVAAKYFELAMGGAIKNAPLAGVEAMLQYVKEIAARMEIDGKFFRIDGGAEEGQVVVHLSERYILRYFNPKMPDLRLSAADAAILQEYPLNTYVQYQFIKVGETASNGSQPVPAAAPANDNNPSAAQLEGSALDAFRLIRQELGEEVFSRQEFQQARIRVSGRMFSYETAAAELEKLVMLGVLKKDESGVPHLYRLRQVFKRGPSELADDACGILSGLGADPGKESIVAAREEVAHLVAMRGIQETAKIASSRFIQGGREPLLQTILLYWPDRDLKLSEKIAIKKRIPDRYKRDIFDKVLARIHRKPLKNRTIRIKGMLTTLLSSAPGGRQLKGYDAGEDTPAPAEPKPYTLKMIHEAFNRLPLSYHWIAGLYYGFPDLYFRILDRQPDAVSAMRLLTVGMTAFLSNLPEKAREALEGEYLAFRDRESGVLKGTELEDTVFVKFMATLWAKVRRTDADEKSRKEAEAADMYFHRGIPLGDIIAESFVSGTAARSAIGRIAAMIYAALPEPLRIALIKDGIERIYLVTKGRHAVLCERGRLNEIISNFGSVMRRKYDEADKIEDRDKRIKEYNDLSAFRSHFFGDIATVDVTRNGSFRMPGSFMADFDSPDSVVLIENIDRRVIEIWPADRVDERPYDFVNEGDLSLALETLADSWDALGTVPFSRMTYCKAREKHPGEDVTEISSANELEALIRLGILKADERADLTVYSLLPAAKRAPPVRFKFMAALMRGLPGHPTTGQFERIQKIVDFLERRYGWELLESVTSMEDAGNRELGEAEAALFSLFDGDALKGGRERIALLKEHSRRIADKAQLIARSLGLGARSIALLRNVAGAHDLGKGISEENMALHYSSKLKKDMTPGERQRLDGHDRDSLSMLAANGIKLPPEAVVMISIDHESDQMGILKELNPELWNLLSIFNITDQFMALTEDRPYERDIKLNTPEALREWLNTKVEDGLAEEETVEAADAVFRGEMPSPKPGPEERPEDTTRGGGIVFSAVAMGLTPEASNTLLIVGSAVLAAWIALNLAVFLKALIAERRLRVFFNEKDNAKKYKMEDRFNIKVVEGGESISLANGIRIFGDKRADGKVDTRILFSGNMSLLFMPFKIAVNLRYSISAWISWTVLRLRLRRSGLFRDQRIRDFMKKAEGQPFYRDFCGKFADTCGLIQDCLHNGFDLVIAPEGHSPPWNDEVSKGLSIKGALQRTDRYSMDRMYAHFYRILRAIDPYSPDPEKLYKAYHVIAAVNSFYPKRAAKSAKSGGVSGFLRKFFLIAFIMMILPPRAWAAADLQYAYYPSGRIQTETFMSDWDGDTPLDPSDDVPAGTVIHRLDEPFYDPGTPLNPNDDFGRIDRRTDPGGSYIVYVYFTGTDDVQLMRGYDSGGALVFSQETVLSDLAVRTYTSGAAETYLIILGKQYMNSRWDTDGTVKTYTYDGSWNLSDIYVYLPDKRLQREVISQGIAEEWTPGWDFARGANLPWIKYGYDIGDGSHGETYEGLATKKAQLLTELRRWKGGHLRPFIFCDLRSGIVFDGSNNPTALSQHVYDDMDALLAQAKALGIKVMPVLLDFMIADGVSVEGSNPVGEYPDIITDPAKRAAFLNLMGEFVAHYADNPEIFAWDLLNEPEEIPESTSVTMAQVQTFLTSFASMVKSRDPGTPVTVGARNRETLMNNWTGLGLTLYSPHYYDYMLPWFPLTDPLSSWGSGLDGPVIYSELEPTSVTVKLADIFGSGMDGGMFWQDATFVLDNTEADSIRAWRDSFIVRPLPPVITDVYANNGNRTFNVNWQPYTGNLQGSATGYTINIGGREFFVSGVSTASADITLPDDMHSGYYGLSIRTEMPDGQYDSEYSAPAVTVYAGKAPGEDEDSGWFGSCGSVAVRGESPGIGWLIPWAAFVAAILMLRFRGRDRRDAKGTVIGGMRFLGLDPFAPKLLPAPAPQKLLPGPSVRRRKPPLGSIYEAFRTLLSETGLRDRSFTFKEFRENRKNANGEIFSESRVRVEIKGLVALGILVPDRTKRVHTYTLHEKYGRAPPEAIEALKRALEPLPADPTDEQIAAVKKEIEEKVLGAYAAGAKPANVIFDRTYPLDRSPADERPWFLDEVEKDVARFAVGMRGGAKLSSILREVLMNAFEAVIRKYESLDGNERASFTGRVSFSVEEALDSFLINVTDSGAGMGPREQGIPASTKDPGQGGSGLSYVNAMLTASGGTLSWAGTPEGGTSVRIILPLDSLDPEHVKMLRGRHAADIKSDGTGREDKAAGESARPPMSRRDAIKADKDLILYFLRELPKLDLELIRLSAERAALQRTKAKGAAEAERQERLAKCLSRLSELKARMNSEVLILSPSAAPADIRDGRDYRQEARDRLNKALSFIEARNESAACALICASARILSEEFAALVKAETKPRRKARVWFDAKEHMHKVMQGQYVVREVEGGRSVPVRERGEHASQLTWQAIRSCDDQLEGMLNELEWIRSILPQVETTLEMMTVRARNEAARTRDRSAQPELADEEKKDIGEKLAYISERTERAVVSEKDITATAAALAKELLDRGRYRSMAEIMGVMRSMLGARARALESMIAAVGGGRLAEMRRMAHSRNSRLMSKIDRISSFLDRGEPVKASNWLFGITRDKDVRNEPEFSKMLPVLWQAQGFIGRPEKEAALKRNIGIFRQRVRLAELLDSFMEDFRDQYVEARLNGASSAAKETSFADNFNRYLEFARENNIGRGSPRLIWAYFYLPAYVSMKIKDPEKPSQKIDNPLFHAFLDLVRMLEIDDIALLADSIKNTKHKKYARVLGVLDAFRAAEITNLSALDDGRCAEFVGALSSDLALAPDQAKELAKAAAIPVDARNLADVSARDVYFDAMLKEQQEMVERKEIYAGEKLRSFAELVELSGHPERWRAEFKEEWEEAFVRENSSLSSDALAGRFLAYFSPAHVYRKDLRRGRSIYKGDATLNDIYTNVLGGFSPILKGECYRSTMEQVWIIREWVYRHLDGMPKERSFDAMDRATPFDVLERSVRGGDPKKTEELAAELERSVEGLFAVVIRRPVLLDKGTLDSAAETVLSFSDRVKKAAQAAGFTMDEGFKIDWIVRELAINILEHSRDNAMRVGEDSDIYGVAAVKVSREGGEARADIFVCDNGGGCDLDVLSNRIAGVKDEGLLSPGGRGIFLSLLHINSFSSGRVVLASHDKMLTYSGVPGSDKAPVGKLERSSGAVKGFLGRATLKAKAENIPVKEEEPAAREEKAEAGKKDAASSVVPELVNGLITAAYNKKKVILAIDEELGEGWTRQELAALAQTISRLTQRNDQLGNFLRNVVIRQGKGEALASDLASLVDRGGMKKEDIIVITNSVNLEYFKEFEGAATITAIDDRQMTDEFYYPLVEITLFSIARAIGYSREDLMRCYKDIPNTAALSDEAILDMCWDAAAKSPRATIILQLVPSAVRVEDKGIYRELGRFITTAA